MGEEAPAAGGFSRQFHPQTYSFTLDKAGQWNDARKSVARLVQRFQALRNYHGTVHQRKQRAGKQPNQCNGILCR